MKSTFGWILLCVAITTSTLFAGLRLAPIAYALYDRAFPEPDYVIGDFAALYGDAGSSAVLFTTSTCPYCKRARELFKREHIEFKDYIVDQSDDAKMRFERIDGAAVPLVFIGNRRIVGFREDVLLESIAIAHRSSLPNNDGNTSPLIP